MPCLLYFMFILHHFHFPVNLTCFLCFPEKWTSTKYHRQDCTKLENLLKQYYEWILDPTHIGDSRGIRSARCYYKGRVNVPCLQGDTEKPQEKVQNQSQSPLNWEISAIPLYQGSLSICPQVPMCLRKCFLMPMRTFMWAAEGQGVEPMLMPYGFLYSRQG